MRSQIVLSFISTLALVLPATASTVQVQVKIENLLPANGLSYAPVRVGFGNGTFDAFNEGQVAPLLGNADISQAPIVSIAEGGSGSTWFPAFAAAEPNATLGTVLAGPLLPGGMSTNTFTVDAMANRYFTFASMVIPSNDHFIGNDSPTEYQLFTAGGALNLSSFTVKANEIWDAGSETQNPANGAFAAGGVNANRVNENGVVRRDFADLQSAYNGLQTAAGYTLASNLTASQDVFRFTFSIVPEPVSLALPMAGLLLTRRRRSAR